MNEKINLCTDTTISQEEEKVVIKIPSPLVTTSPPIKFNCNIQKGKDSIIETVDTGFGCTNQIAIDCKKPKYKSHLCKENYLGEFKQETEKSLARHNLGVYSKEEIDLIVGNIIIQNNGFATKSEVQKMIKDADFVNSTLRSYANYQIPDNLFKL